MYKQYKGPGTTSVSQKPFPKPIRQLGNDSGDGFLPRPTGQRTAAGGRRFFTAKVSLRRAGVNGPQFSGQITSIDYLELLGSKLLAWFFGNC